MDTVNIFLESDELVMHGNPSRAIGSVLRGVVALDLKQPARIKSIRLRFTGQVTRRYAVSTYPSHIRVRKKEEKRKIQSSNTHVHMNRRGHTGGREDSDQPHMVISAFQKDPNTAWWVPHI